MSIFVVRHGETAENRGRVVQLPDVPLSDRGRRQAERVAERLAREGVGRILASDLRRAAMTAEALAERTALAVETEPLLQERNFGDVRGTPYAELDVDLFAPDFAPPRGESWTVFHARVERAFARIVEAAAETRGHLVVVTHGLVCQSLALHHLAVPGTITVPLHFANTSVTVVDPETPFTVRLLNCTAHLGDAVADGATAPL